MAPLHLDDLTALQAALEALEEHDLISELAPAAVAVPALRPTDGALPPVPPPAERVVRRTGPLPPLAPTRVVEEPPCAVAVPAAPSPRRARHAAAPATATGLLGWALDPA